MTAPTDVGVVRPVQYGSDMTDTSADFVLTLLCPKPADVADRLRRQLEELQLCLARVEKIDTADRQEAARASARASGMLRGVVNNLILSVEDLRKIDGTCNALAVLEAEGAVAVRSAG